MIWKAEISKGVLDQVIRWGWFRIKHQLNALNGQIICDSDLRRVGPLTRKK